MTILEECLGESTECAFVPILKKIRLLDQGFVTSKFLEPYAAVLR